MSAKKKKKKVVRNFIPTKINAYVRSYYPETTSKSFPDLSSVVGSSIEKRQKKAAYLFTYHAKKKERKKEKRGGEKIASSFCPPWKEEEKKKEQSESSRLHREEVVPLSCSSNLIPPPPPSPFSMALFRSLETFSTSRRQRERESVRVVDKRGERAECVCKSFKRPVKKLHWRPASAVKHKANYRLNIFRYILSCRDRRGLRSLFLFFLNHPPLFPFPSRISCTLPMNDEPDQE